MFRLKNLFLLLLNLVLMGVLGFVIFGSRIVQSDMNTVIAHDPYPVSERAANLHRTLTIGDWHADPLMWRRNLLKEHNYGQVDFPRLAKGNVALQMFTTVTKSPSGLNYEENSAEARDNITLVAMGQLWPPRTWDSLTERALFQSKKLHGFEAEAPETLKIIRTKSDLTEVLAKRAAGEPLIGALIGAEGGHALDMKIENLDRLYNAGFRMIGLTHFFDNALGGSLHGIGNHGLTDFGREVVREMVKRKIIIDLAHASPKMAEEVLAMVDVPTVVSHTGIHSHCETHRNFKDPLMQKIAAAGGLIAIGYWADVTCDASPAGVAGAIVAAINLVGEDHVSLGSDYDGSVETGFDTSELSALTHALIEKGLSDQTIAKVMGGNMVRFLSDQLPD